MTRALVSLALLSSCAPYVDPIPSRFDGAGEGARIVGTCSGATHATIQEAIDAAVDGDVIEICPGTYLEALVIDNKALTLTPVFGPGTVTLSGEFSWRPVTILNGSTVTIEDLLIHFGHDDTIGGNIYANGELSRVELFGNDINDGFAPIGGGLATDQGCHGWVDGNEFRDNGATWGGAVYIQADEDVFVFENNLVNGNSAVYGGGVYTDGAAPVLDNDITVNFATGDGGGMFGLGGGGLARNTIVGNSADGNGGAIFLTGGSEGGDEPGDVYSNDIRDNHASSGAGVYVDDLLPTTTIASNAFSANIASVSGGGVHANGVVNLLDNEFDGNVASDRGGHLYLQDATTTMTRESLNNGAALTGGAVYVALSEISFRNVIFDSNTATGSGGAMELDDVTGEILNSVVYRNGGPGGAGFRVRSSPTLDIRNNIFFQNLDSAALRVSGGQPIVAFNDFRANSPSFVGMPNVVGVDGNVNVKPRFVQPAVGNFQLRSTSSLIDAGDPAILDVDASTSDIGRFGGPDAFFVP